MQISLEGTHQVFEIISGIALALGAWWAIASRNISLETNQKVDKVGQETKEQLATIRESQLKNQLAAERYNAKLREELVARDSIIAGDLRDHQTKDESFQRDVVRTHSEMRDTLRNIETCIREGNKRGSN